MGIRAGVDLLQRLEVLDSGIVVLKMENITYVCTPVETLDANIAALKDQNRSSVHEDIDALLDARLYLYKTGN